MTSVFTFLMTSSIEFNVLIVYSDSFLFEVFFYLFYSKNCAVYLDWAVGVVYVF